MTSKARIVVIDDEVNAATALETLLKEDGYEAVSAYDAATGLGLVEQIDADVVLTDLRMPGMDGHELIRRLRQLPSCASTRFLISTGDATAAALHPGDDAMADVVVVNKPYDVDALVDLVEAG